MKSLLAVFALLVSALCWADTQVTFSSDGQSGHATLSKCGGDLYMSREASGWRVTVTGATNCGGVQVVDGNTPPNPIPIPLSPAAAAPPAPAPAPARPAGGKTQPGKGPAQPVDINMPPFVNVIDLDSHHTANFFLRGRDYKRAAAIIVRTPRGDVQDTISITNTQAQEIRPAVTPETTNDAS
jgi:hypothetical protein